MRFLNIFKKKKTPKQQIEDAVKMLEVKIIEITNKRNEFNKLVSERKAELLLAKIDGKTKEVESLEKIVTRLEGTLSYQDNTIATLKEKRDLLTITYLEADIKYNLEKTTLELDFTNVDRLISDLDNLGKGFAEVNNTLSSDK